MKFIGRQRELKSLEREYQRYSSFFVIYGRRRVGKTTLIKEFIKGKTTFYLKLQQNTPTSTGGEMNAGFV